MFQDKSIQQKGTQLRAYSLKTSWEVFSVNLRDALRTADRRRAKAPVLQEQLPVLVTKGPHLK